METMLAARYLGPNEVKAEEVELPPIGNEEALVEVLACGFCGSDINIVAGTHPRARAPLILGHELAGRIRQINSAGAELSVGDLVTMFPLIFCGECHACRNGRSHVCRDLKLFGFDLDGGMAQFIKLPISALMKLPDDMPAKIGALIEPLAVAVHGLKRADATDANLVVVLGAGPIGLLTALAAKQMGIENVVISDVRSSRRELARKMGLRTAEAGSVLKREVLEQSNGEGADLIFECAGHPSSALEMTALARSRGTIVNLGVFKKSIPIDMQTVNFKELTIIGSRVYSRSDFEVAIELAAKLPLEHIVTHSYALHEVDTAFQEFETGQVCKALIIPMEQ